MSTALDCYTLIIHDWSLIIFSVDSPVRRAMWVVIIVRPGDSIVLIFVSLRIYQDSQLSHSFHRCLIGNMAFYSYHITGHTSGMYRSLTYSRSWSFTAECEQHTLSEREYCRLHQLWFTQYVHIIIQWSIEIWKNWTESVYVVLV